MIVSLVSILDPKVIALDVEINKRKDELLFDKLPLILHRKVVTTFTTQIHQHPIKFSLRTNQRLTATRTTLNTRKPLTLANP